MEIDLDDVLDRKGDPFLLAGKGNGGDGPSVEAIAFGPGGRTLVVLVHCTLYEFDLPGGSLRRTYPLDEERGDCWWLRYTPDGRTLVSIDARGNGGSEFVTGSLWDTSTGDCRTSIDLGESFVGADLDTEGARLFVASQQALEVHAIATGESLGSVDLEEELEDDPDLSLCAMCWDPAASRIAALDIRGRTRLYEPDGLTLERRIRLKRGEWAAFERVAGVVEGEPGMPVASFPRTAAACALATVELSEVPLVTLPSGTRVWWRPVMSKPALAWLAADASSAIVQRDTGLFRLHVGDIAPVALASTATGFPQSPNAVGLVPVAVDDAGAVMAWAEGLKLHIQGARRAL
jgi:hypothetical protein